MEKLTRKIQIKKPLNEVQKDELLKQISNAYQEMDKMSLDLKEYTKEMKDSIEEKQDEVRMALGNYNQGGIFESVECVIEYKDGMTIYLDAKTEVEIEHHDTTDEEQLWLTQSKEHRIDAEDLIREDSNKD